MVNNEEFERIVEKRYKKDKYLHELAIIHHLEELNQKYKKFLAEDRKPFKEESFLKELADLFILINMFSKFYPEFFRLILERKEKFFKNTINNK